MNDLVKRYLHNFDLKISTSSITREEIEMQKKVLVLLEQLELISKKENQAWQERLVNIMCDEYIDKFCLPTRPYLYLSRAGIKTLYQLREVVLNGDLLNIRNIGNKWAGEIISYCIEKSIVKKEELPIIYNHLID